MSSAWSGLRTRTPPDVERLLAVIEDHAGQGALDARRLEPFELFDEIRGKGHGGLDLDRYDCALFLASRSISLPWESRKK